jgi:hypothetical protein
MSRNVKLLIYKTIIGPVVMYTSETWALTKENERALNTWERKIIRKIYGPINEGGQWRIKTNTEFQKLYGKQDMVAFIKKGRLRWLGLVERKDSKFRSERCMADQEEDGKKEDPG